MKICNDIISNRKQRVIEIINIAWRPEPEHAAGGPSGVLKLIQETVGSEYRGYTLKYRYETNKFTIIDDLKNFFIKEKISPMVRKLPVADWYVQNILSKTFKQRQNIYTQRIFVCHDVGSAVGAYFLGIPYYLIYHHQGSLIKERESFGATLSNTEKTLLNQYEKTAFDNANKVFFPSLGAKNEFLTSTENLIKLDNISSKPLYNSIPKIEFDENGANEFIKEHQLTKYFNGEYIKFISIGDYSENKGLDQVNKFLTNLNLKRINKKIFWLSLGSKVGDEIIERIRSEGNFAKYNHIEKIPHAIAMSLLQKSDVFIMMQRCSIFDFSTLEAMSLKKPIILSNVGGNIDFNKENNIVYCDVNNNYSLSDDIFGNLKTFGEKNGSVFDKYFSNKTFVKGYLDLYNLIIKKYILRNIDIKNTFVDSLECKKLFHGRDVLIVGPGSSFSPKVIDSKYKNYTKAALNSGLTLPVNFDVHFMQDRPNPQSLWKEYLSYKGVRIYGIANRRANIVGGIEWEKLRGEKYYTYSLDQTNYDRRYSVLKSNLVDVPVQDMQSVLFSAIQIISYFKPRSINLIGIDFSDSNYNGKNISKYSKKVWTNFEALIQFLKKKEITLNIVRTTSKDIFDIASKYFQQNRNSLIAIPNNKKQKKYRKLKKLLKNPRLYFSDMLRNLANRIDGKIKE